MPRDYNKMKRYTINAFGKGLGRHFLETDDFNQVIMFVCRQYHYYSDTVFWIEDRLSGRRKLPKETVQTWYKDYWVMSTKEITKKQLIRYNKVRKPILEYIRKRNNITVE